jgi:hypothetical protein
MTTISDDEVESVMKLIGDKFKTDSGLDVFMERFNTTGPGAIVIQYDSVDDLMVNKSSSVRYQTAQQLRRFRIPRLNRLVNNNSSHWLMDNGPAPKNMIIAILCEGHQGICEVDIEYACPKCDCKCNRIHD